MALLDNLRRVLGSRKGGSKASRPIIDEDLMLNTGVNPAAQQNTITQVGNMRQPSLGTEGLGLSPAALTPTQPFVTQPNGVPAVENSELMAQQDLLRRRRRGLFNLTMFGR